MRRKKRNRKRMIQGLKNILSFDEFKMIAGLSNILQIRFKGRVRD